MSSTPSAPFSSLVPAPADPNPDDFTLDQVKGAFPTAQRSLVTQEYVDKLNAVSSDPITRDIIKDNFIGYLSIIKEGKFKIEDYLNAVTYVTYKLMKHTDRDAYAKTFPDRYMDLVSKGTPDKTIASYVSIYKKGKLVNLIWEQTAIPTWVLNQDVYQDAINTQADLMKNATSELVRTQAANSLLTHLKRPEAVKGGLNISLSDSDQKGMAALTDAITALAKNQQSAIAGGNMKTIDVAAMPLFKGEDE